MEGKTAQSAVRRCAGVLVVAFCAAAVPASAGNSHYAISRSVVASGGGVVSASCYTMVSTLGQAIAGESVAKDGGSQYRLTSGFLSAQSALDDTLFRNGFEFDTGDCTP
ncbi:hypothetical protein [Dokdonella sp.]|uniref:hypothetical protein n=1 Tax=Dokdonella sp. TaxID=2291710 RepID=UPI00262C378A|nr:hypothetical protein [Dokdonella sp.]